MSDTYTAAIALFDQNWAAVNDKLDYVIDAYRQYTEQNPQAWIPLLGPFIEDLQAKSTHPSAVELLTVAIRRLAYPPEEL